MQRVKRRGKGRGGRKKWEGKGGERSTWEGEAEEKKGGKEVGEEER